MVAFSNNLSLHTEKSDKWHLASKHGNCKEQVRFFSFETVVDCQSKMTLVFNVQTALHVDVDIRESAIIMNVTIVQSIILYLIFCYLVWPP